ncbi:MAG: hypothetical protein IPK85_03285 [Gemmatimonadetes bacterium]|nr:hypothetical protein [Gemmatimonadota bacterium]
MTDNNPVADFESELDRAFNAALPDDSPELAVPSGDAEPAKADAPPAPDVSTPQIGVDRGDGRDATGKWVGKGQEPAKAGEGMPAPDAVLPDAEVEAAKAPDPFRVRFRGGEHEVIPGAVVREDGLLVPKEHIQRAQELFGRALKYDEERAQVKEQLLRSRQAESSAKANETAMQAEINRLFEIAGLQNDEELAVQAVQYMLELRQSRPILEQRIALEREKAELALQRELQAPDPEQTREHVTQQVVGTAAEHLRSFEPHLQGLTEEDGQTILQRVMDDPERYAYRVGRTLSERERAAGVQPGEVVFDVDALYRDVQVLHSYRQKIIAAEAAQREAVKAAQANARATANAAPPPPAPTTNGKAEADKPRQIAKGQTWDEFKESLAFTLD